ncbi:hypothetical protein LEP1GSC043_3716 [Leptospira weilii str. Ecochallenge]|uniref:Uncharacterized protein n=1 Tax=Leptospira weilii str. Ecochallenge TaxID=1049986 RepID=N1UC85_9LEPT|nr:hypothetical protein LEP1GSC043_3716 [Leptospira weilii str. Ecochallenge]
MKFFIPTFIILEERMRVLILFDEIGPRFDLFLGIILIKSMIREIE